MTREIFDVAEKLTDDVQSSAVLPFLKHDGEKTAIKIKAYEIRIRRYDEKGVQEKVIRIEK